MKTCESCGMPIDEKTTSKFDSRYCIYCQDQETGKLKSKEEVKEGSISAAIRLMGKTREEAEKMADKMMPDLPRWKNSKTHVLKKPAEFSFIKVGIKGKKFPVSEVTARTGICQIETEKGHETTIIEHKCDFVYYILEGQGYFEINGQKEDFVQEDLVVVPAGSAFTYKGKCKMLLITTPPYYPEQEETLL